LRAVLIDSDILIEVSRARDQAILALWEDLALREMVFLTSPVVIAELWHGVRPKEIKTLAALFRSMTCVSIDAEIGQRAGGYLREYAKSHHVELGDALIAATVSVHKAELWTRNRRHYPMKDVIFFD